ncbi:hypothetical protein ACIQU5_03200 [Streptomyces sp. NPDC090306]|uniref:hypothetical protein n=1 Tax=Streptomyces sp. NPDC090306 TaxID=3365961 RepID=UPI00382681C6
MGGRGWFRWRRDGGPAPFDEDITAFGEELARYEFVLTGQDSDRLALADYERALEAYEAAKRLVAGGRDRADAAADVERALADGRHALALARARAAGEPLPAPRPPCFFDARHGPSVTDVHWAPPEGTPRLVAVCAADAVRLAEGRGPLLTGRVSPAPTPAAGAAVRARRADPRPTRTAPVPAGRGAGWRPYRTWPPGTDAGQRAEGRGDKDVRLARPEPERAVILVVRLSGAGSATLPERYGAQVLGRGGSPRRAVVPLPPSEVDSVRVRVETDGGWHMWLQPLGPGDHVPVLTDGTDSGSDGGAGGGSARLRSRGPYLFRYAGGPVTVRAGQRGGGALRFDALPETLDSERRLLDGRGTCEGEFRVDGPTLVRVWSEADWHVAVVPDQGLRSGPFSPVTTSPGWPRSPRA